MMLKKLTIYIVLAVLCPFLGLGQGAGTGAADVTLKGLQIGQKVSEVMLSGLHNYKDAGGKSVSSAKLSDFRGKLLILDFWATWCSPCVAMIPRMDSLQREFGEKIAFLSVSYQSDKEVLPFLDRLEKQQGRRFNLPVLNADKVLHGLFPHITLPHYVWIDDDGMVRAVSTQLELTSVQISKMLANSKTNSMSRKVDMKVAYDRALPLLVAGNGGDGSSFIGHSLLTGYIQGLESGYAMSSTDLGLKLTGKNMSVSWLYRLGYGAKINQYLGNNRILVEVAVPASVTNAAVGSMEERNKNSYCYELIVSAEERNTFYQQMLADLDRFFPQFEVALEKRTLPCLVLEKTTENNLFASKGGKSSSTFRGAGFKLTNFSLVRLVTELNMMYLANSPRPLIDQTGYQGLVDLKVDAKLSDVTALSAQLERYGLRIVEKDATVDMVVVRDRKKTIQN